MLAAAVSIERSKDTWCDGAAVWVKDFNYCFQMNGDLARFAFSMMQ